VFYVYLLQSKLYKKETYVGSTNDLLRRLKEHNEGKEKSTKRYKPWSLVSYEAYQVEKDAWIREQKLKQHGNAMKYFKLKSKYSFKDEADSSSSIFFEKKDDRCGFTLVEAIVAIGVFSMIILGVGSILVYGFKYRAVIMEQLKTQTEGRKIIQDFVNEIRRANYSSVGAYPIVTADTQEIIFYSNVDTDSWREKVRYFLDGDILKRGTTKPTGTPLSYNPANEIVVEMIHDVYNTSTPIFYYLGQDYDGTSSTDYLSTPVSVSQVRAVKFDLYLEADPNMSPKPLRVQGIGEIRNLKSN